MPSDPFLDAHRVAERCFEVGGCFSPASVRDQMLRAYAVVQRAFDEGLIDEYDRKLLVIGAGSTGLTAAVAAAERGVETWVVEKRPHMLFRLLQCPTRDIDPTLYDWPADHWQSGRFPVDGDPMPLEWDYGFAANIAAHWQGQMATLHPSVIAKLRLLAGAHPDFGTPAVPPVPGANGLTSVDILDVSTGKRVTTVDCGAVVSCVGWKSELTSVPKSPRFKGFDFWEADPLQQPLRLVSGRPPRVLIAGGGDGALQDFIRIATHRDARSFLQAILGIDAAVGGRIEQLRDSLKHPEDVAQRALSWSSDDLYDDPVFTRLEAAYETALDELAASPVWARLRGGIEGMLTSPMPRITLAHTGTVFRRCYGLNRFLALLILRVADPARVSRLKETYVDSVTSAGLVSRRTGLQHQCNLVARACHLRAHDVGLRQPGAVVQTHRFEVVVLRLGVDATQRTAFGIVPDRVRHLLPYYVA